MTEIDESEVLDILECMLDAADIPTATRTGITSIDKLSRTGLCRIPDDDAEKLRQYIAGRRAAPGACHYFKAGECALSSDEDQVVHWSSWSIGPIRSGPGFPTGADSSASAKRVDRPAFVYAVRGSEAAELGVLRLQAGK
jgi:hypothetical protein